MSILLKTSAGEVRVRNAYGSLLTDITSGAGVMLNTRCGGRGVCRGCVVELGQGQYLIGDEQIVVATDEVREALACQVRVASEDACIVLPDKSLVEQDVRIDDDFKLGQFVHDAQTRKYALRVPPPVLETQVSDQRRVEKELLRHAPGRDYRFPPRLLRRLPHVLMEGGGKITVTVGRMDHHWCVIEVEPGNTTSIHLGVAVDVGTTTVVAMLVDLNQGKVLKKASLYNQQIGRADDVASRISYCENDERLAEMQDLVVEKTINALLGDMCKELTVDPASISRLAVSGNTVMAHLFLGITPEGIGRLPFQPVANIYGEFHALDVGVAMHPDGIVDVIPSVAGYVGGDIVSDMYVAGLTRHPELTLMVDIGTNGEMVLSEDGAMYVCATAAGPAFEGAGILHGRRAAAGAIESITIGPGLDLAYGVIGNTAPRGLCGTAIIDFIAEGARCGLINPVGRFDVDLLKKAERYTRVETENGASHACVIADAETSGTNEVILVSEMDVAEILKAKAATYAGMKTLLDVQGKTFADLQRFVLAGGFARHIKIENAIRIGLLPDIDRGLFDVIGNGSLAGAFLALVEPAAMPAFKTLSSLPHVVELNLEKTFEPNFIDALVLP